LFPFFSYVQLLRLPHLLLCLLLLLLRIVWLLPPLLLILLVILTSSLVGWATPALRRVLGNPC